MHFINSKLGWVVGGGSVSGEIFKTSDGGNYWTEQDSPAEKCLFGLYFIDSLVGWCTGMDGTILKTSNGGEDWELKNNGVPEGQWLEDIYFYDSLKGFAVGEGIILYSVDGGETWSEKENVSGWADKICFIDENNGWILGTEAGVGKGIDGSGNIDLYGSSEAKIWKTSNGGDDWEETPTVLLTGNALAEVIHPAKQKLKCGL